MIKSAKYVRGHCTTVASKNHKTIILVRSEQRMMRLLKLHFS